MSRKIGFIPLGLLGAAVLFVGVSELWRDGRVGQPPEPPLDERTLVMWNNEMVRAHVRGDWTKAEKIARKIMSKPAWREFVPANAVMGSITARKGDYAAAESFFKVALSGKGAAAPQPVVMNDYADTLRHLKRYAEAEQMARRAITESGGRIRLYKVTLAQIQQDAENNAKEVNAKEKQI